MAQKLLGTLTWGAYWGQDETGPAVRHDQPAAGVQETDADGRSRAGRVDAKNLLDVIDQARLRALGSRGRSLGARPTPAPPGPRGPVPTL